MNAQRLAEHMVQELVKREVTKAVNKMTVFLFHILSVWFISLLTAGLTAWYFFDVYNEFKAFVAGAVLAFTLLIVSTVIVLVVQTGRRKHGKVRDSKQV